MLSLSLPALPISDSHSFVFIWLSPVVLSVLSSMLNIFAVFWNTGINWMIAYKMGWVVGFIYIYVYIYLHSKPQQPLLTHLPTPEHDTAAETVNEQHRIHSDLTTEKMACFSSLHPASFPLADGLRWITAPQAFLGENSQSSFNLIL